MEAQMPSYLIHWKCNIRENMPKAPPTWTPLVTEEVHNKPSRGMRASRSGVIAIFTSDGWVSLVDAGTLKETTPKRKVHNHVCSAVAFREDLSEIVTAGLDYKYFFLPMSSGSILGYIRDLFVNMILFMFILLYFAEWLV